MMERRKIATIKRINNTVAIRKLNNNYKVSSWLHIKFDEDKQGNIVDYDFYMPNDKLVPIRKRDKKEIVQKFYNKRNETDKRMERVF